MKKKKERGYVWYSLDHDTIFVSSYKPTKKHKEDRHTLTLCIDERADSEVITLAEYCYFVGVL